MILIAESRIRVIKSGVHLGNAGSTASTARRTLHIKTAMSAKNPNTPHSYNVISSMLYSSALWHVGAARASRPCRACQPARPALPLVGGLALHQPAAPAILHGLARRTAPFASQAVGRHKKAPPERSWRRVMVVTVAKMSSRRTWPS